MTQELVGERVTWAPESNTERSAAAALPGAVWHVVFLGSPVMGRLAGQACALLEPEHGGRRLPRERRWVPVARVVKEG